MYHWNKFNGAFGDIDAPVDEFCDTETPQDALDEPTDEFVHLPRAPSIHEYEDPPSDYIPTGFIYFMTRGPLADEKYRVDTLTLDQYLERGILRIDSRKEESKTAAADRNFDQGKGD